MRAGLRHVLSTDAPDFDEALSGLCRQLRCRMAFDAVGGELTGRLVEAMGGGRRCWSTARWRWRP
jgi:NADPH2:quinone reductase